MLNVEPTPSSEALRQLRQTLKQMVIDECNVKNVSPDQISDDEPIIGGRGALRSLDSLDAVEIASALERRYGIKLESAGLARQIFKSFTCLSEYVAGHAAPEPPNKPPVTV